MIYDAEHVLEDCILHHISPLVNSNMEWVRHERVLKKCLKLQRRQLSSFENRH